MGGRADQCQGLLRACLSLFDGLGQCGRTRLGAVAIELGQITEQGSLQAVELRT
ncbi:hypothetical protein D3C77_699660 [compost metagenome]